MSFLFNDPELMAAAAADLAGIGTTISSANQVAASPTSSIAPAGQDAVSAAVADMFSAHGQSYTNFSSQLANFHDQFVTNLRDSATSYADTEAANASSLQSAGQGALGAAAAPAEATPSSLGSASGNSGQVETTLNAPTPGLGAVGGSGAAGGSELGSGASGGAAGAGISTGLGSRGAGGNGGNGGRAGYRRPAQ
jgi:hypothetical protein